MPTGTRSIARIDRASTRSITPKPPRVQKPDTIASRRSTHASSERETRPERVTIRTATRPLLARVFEIAEELTHVELLVLLALHSFADAQSGEAFPTHQTLARRARLGVRSVRRALVTLEKKRLVTHQRRGRTSNTYCVVTDFDVRPSGHAGRREAASVADQKRPAWPTEVPKEESREGETPVAPSKGALPAGVSLGAVELDRTSSVDPRTAAPEATTPLEAPSPAGADASVELPETALDTECATRPAGLYETAMADREGISVEEYRRRCAAARVSEIPDNGGKSSPKIREDAQATAKRNKARAEAKRTPPGEEWVPSEHVLAALDAGVKMGGPTANVDTIPKGCPYCHDRAQAEQAADGAGRRSCRTGRRSGLPPTTTQAATHEARH